MGLTFTKLADSRTIGSDLPAMVKKHGSPGKTLSKEWRAYVDRITGTIDKNMVIFEREQKAYAEFAAAQIKKCKDATAEALKIPGKLKNGWNQTEYDRLLQIENLISKLVASIDDAKNDLATKHQPFRGDLVSIDAKAGAPQELLDYRKSFSARRKKTIDASEALSKKLDKVKSEYVSRINTAKKWCDELRKDQKKKTVLVHDQLKGLGKILNDWNDRKSAKWSEYETKIKRIKGTVEAYKQPSRSGYTKEDFDKTEDFVRKRVGPLCAQLKQKLNTDHKKLEMVRSVAGDDWNNRQILDQKLVKDLEGGFEKVKKEVKELETRTVNALLKELEGYKKKHKVK